MSIYKTTLMIVALLMPICFGYSQSIKLYDVHLSLDSDSLIFSNQHLQLTFDKQSGEFANIRYKGLKTGLNLGSEKGAQVDFSIGGKLASELFNDQFVGFTYRIATDLSGVYLKKNHALYDSLGVARFLYSHVLFLKPESNIIEQSSIVQQTCSDELQSDAQLEHIRFSYSLPKLPEWDVSVPGPWFPNSFVKPGTTLLDWNEGKKVRFHSAPDAGFGLLVFANRGNNTSLGLWMDTGGEVNYIPEIKGGKDHIDILFENQRAVLFQCGLEIQSDKVMVSFEENVEDVLNNYRANATKQFPLNPVNPDWVKELAILEVYPKYFSGGFDEIKEKLIFYKDIGINAIYLMPHWEGGYSPIDFYEVNSNYGTKESLKALVDQAHQFNMKVFFDMVIHGFSSKSPMLELHPNMFVKSIDGQIARHPTWKSMSTDWANEQYLQYMENLARHHVIAYGIDGYRFDAASFKGPGWDTSVPYPAYKSGANSVEVMRRMLGAMREEKPEAMILNEIFGPAFYNVSNLAHDNQTEAPQQFLEMMERNEVTIADYKTHLTAVYKMLPEGANRVFFARNHDTSWFYHFNGYTRPFMNLEAIHAFCGIPEIFTGDHREGQANPDDDKNTWQVYSKILAMRHEYPSVIHGALDFDGVSTNSDDVFSAVRKHNNEKTFILVSFSDKPEKIALTLSGELSGNRKNNQKVQLKDLLSGHVFTVPVDNIKLEPFQVVIGTVKAQQ
ncbi:MAG: alpha-amylase family glycosyl hydrolase [Cyclobacteriaceae bacterium]